MKSLVEQFGIKIRRATLYDALIVYKWAVDPEIRRNFINKDSFSFEHHMKWYQEKLASENTRLFILESYCPLGQVRFDLNQDQSWTVNYLLDPVFWGIGIGKKIIEEGLKINGKGTYYAWVKENNVPSLKVFRGLNFKEKGCVSEDHPDLILFEYENDLYE